MTREEIIAALKAYRAITTKKRTVDFLIRSLEEPDKEQKEFDRAALLSAQELIREHTEEAPLLFVQYGGNDEQR